VTAALRVALIGAGSMGANHARVIAESEGAVLTSVVDSNQERAAFLADLHGARAAADLDGLEGCDAVVVATSSPAHFEVGMQVIGRGLPMLMEKPLAPALQQARELIAASEAAGTPLMCGFVERFNPVIIALQQQLSGVPPMHLLSVRHSPPVERQGDDVADDLLIHDLDLVLRLWNQPVARISGAALSPSGQAEAMGCILQGDGVLATISVSRLGQRKIRTMSVSTPDALYELDMLRHDMTIYRHIRHAMVAGSYRSTTTVDVPFIRHGGEPLQLQFAHFLALLGSPRLGRRSGDSHAAPADIDSERRSMLPPHELIARLRES
jgi:predicted dehydrogenase